MFSPSLARSSIFITLQTKPDAQDVGFLAELLRHLPTFLSGICRVYLPAFSLMLFHASPARNRRQPISVFE